MDQAVVERESEPLWTHLLNLAPQGSRLIDGAGQRLDSEDLGCRFRVWIARAFHNPHPHLHRYR
jgi:hypothetical protein